MGTLVLFVLAALAFSVLTGAIEASWARRRKQALKQRLTLVLHPLTRHGLRVVREPVSTRTLHLVGLFFGFLLVTYVGGLLLKMLHRWIAHLS